MPSLFTLPLVTVVYSTLALCNGFVRLRFCKREMFRGLMTRNFETNFIVLFLFFFFLIFHYEDYVNIRLRNISFILFLTTRYLTNIFVLYLRFRDFINCGRNSSFVSIEFVEMLGCYYYYFLLSDFFFSFLFFLFPFFFYIFIYFYFFILFFICLS